MLTRRLGDAGKKIHSGRSRNDQVLVDLKLFLRDELRQVADAVKRVFDRLQEQSEKYKEVLMPGYTHLQIAMPSSFGLWFGAYAETLADDMRLVAAAWHIANQNPLGSAAGYGSSFPLDRTMTTRLMGFEELHYNEIALLTTNLPVGYHRDLQLLKDILFPATTEIKRTLSMCDFMLAHIRVNEHILDDKKYDYLFTVEDVNRMVLAGTPFREAYKQVGMAVQRGEYTPTREVRHTHEGSIGNLCTAQIRRKMERVMQEFE